MALNLWSSAVPEPMNPVLPKLRDWPMFRAPAGARRKTAHDGRAPPHISELIMSHVPGSPSEKLVWLREQQAMGLLNSDDPHEIAEAEALLAMLARIDELLDEGLRATFPASDPVAVGHFTATEPPSRPVDREAVDLTRGKVQGRKAQARRHRAE